MQKFSLTSGQRFIIRFVAFNIERTLLSRTSRRNVAQSCLQVFMVELTRGWNSRLGFSLQPEGSRTVISVVHPDSVAAKDGRLRQGDVLLMVSLARQTYPPFLPIFPERIS